VEIYVLTKSEREAYVGAFEREEDAIAYMKNIHPNAEWTEEPPSNRRKHWTARVGHKSQVFSILEDAVN
jgi:hypothetical protein